MGSCGLIPKRLLKSYRNWVWQEHWIHLTADPWPFKKAADFLLVLISAIEKKKCPILFQNILNEIHVLYKCIP
jgi:hypothetical protein